MRAAIGLRSYSTGLSGPLSGDDTSRCVGSGHRYSSDAMIHVGREEPSV